MAKHARERTQSAINRDVRELFKTDRGQRVLRAMMLNNYVFETTANAPNRDVAEGQRRVVLDIIRVCRGEIDPEAFANDYKEVVTDRAREHARHDPLTGDPL